jgi:hypothetical protein
MALQVTRRTSSRKLKQGTTPATFPSSNTTRLHSKATLTPASNGLHLYRRFRKKVLLDCMAALAFNFHLSGPHRRVRASSQPWLNSKDKRSLKGNTTQWANAQSKAQVSDLTPKGLEWTSEESLILGTIELPLSLVSYCTYNTIKPEICTATTTKRASYIELIDKCYNGQHYLDMLHPSFWVEMIVHKHCKTDNKDEQHFLPYESSQN